jgi:hypothetical protein
VRAERTGRGLAVGQGAFYLAAGVWPLLDEASFEAITGPKRERWLVKTVGLLIAVVGATLAAAGARRAVSPEIALLGLASAGALAGIDGWYAGVRRRIAPVYLADAAVEAALAAAWVVAAARGRSRSGHGGEGTA